MQKYRLYLKRLSAVASQQASIVAALGGNDPFMRMSAFEGLHGYQSFVSSAALPSFSPQGLLNRNNPASFAIQGVSASRPIQIATGNTTMSHSIGDPNDKYHLSLPGTSCLQGNLAQGLPTPVGQVQLPQKWIHEETDDLSTILSASGRANSGVPGTLQSVTNSHLLQQGFVERRQDKVVIQPSSSASSDRPEGTVGVSSSLMDSCATQQRVVPLSAFSSSASPMNGSFCSNGVAELGATSSGGTSIFPSNDLRIERDSKVGASSFGSVILLSPDTVPNQKYLNFGGGSDLRSNMEGGNAGNLLNPKLLWSCLPASQPPNLIGSHHPMSQRLNLGGSMVRQTTASASAAAPQTRIDMFISGDAPKSASDLSFPKVHSELSSSSCSFDGLLNSIIKVVRRLLLCFNN
jgi:two-component response regulator ARR-B family